MNDDLKMDTPNLTLNQPGKIGILKNIGKLLAGLFGLFIVLNILLFIFQDQLIYFPKEISTVECNHINESYNHVEDIFLQMKDGTRLHGWVVGCSLEKTSNLLIYFGGNGDELSQMIGNFQRYPDWSVVLINYRGYGQSEGKPGEKNLFSDALEIYDYLETRADFEHTNKVVMGRSLGTGVAVYLAKNREFEGVILSSPYDSLLSVAQEKLPMVPVKYLLRNKFDSISYAPSIKAPVLICIAKEDKLIYPWHSRVLAKRFGGTVVIQEIEGATHDSILQKNEYWQAVSAFLKLTRGRFSCQLKTEELTREPSPCQDSRIS